MRSRLILYSANKPYIMEPASIEFHTWSFPLSSEGIYYNQGIPRAMKNIGRITIVIVVFLVLLYCL